MVTNAEHPALRAAAALRSFAEAYGTAVQQELVRLHHEREARYAANPRLRPLRRIMEERRG